MDCLKITSTINKMDLVIVNQYDTINDICTICHEDINGDLDVSINKCSHSFHTQCINKWFRHTLNRSCPLCRTKWKYN